MNKQIISSIVSSAVVCLILLGLFTAGRGAEQVQVPVQDNGVGNIEGTDVITSGNVKADGLVSSNRIQNFQKVLEISKGSNYVFWTNKSNSPVFITDASIFTAGAASSSVKIFLYATTSPLTLASGEHFINPTISMSRRILGGILVATSTAATTTSTFNEIALGTVGTTNGIVRVNPGSQVLLWVQNASNGGSPLSRCSFNATASDCNAATSTNLGIYPLQAVIHGFSTSTSPFPPSGL